MGKEIITSRMTVTRGEEEIEVIIEGYVEYETDTRYGEDADGHKGVSRTFIEDVTDIHAYDVEGYDFDLTEEEEDWASQVLGEKFLMG